MNVRCYKICFSTVEFKVLRDRWSAYFSISTHVDACQHILTYWCTSVYSSIFQSWSYCNHTWKPLTISKGRVNCFHIWKNHLPHSKEAEYIAPIFENLSPYSKETEYIFTVYDLHKSLTQHIQKTPSILLPCSEITYHLRKCVWGVQTTSCPFKIFSMIVHAHTLM